MDFSEARRLVDSIQREVRRVYVGKPELVKLAVATLLAGGHLLIEGFPGTGKTLLAKTLAKVIGGEFRRVQGHPDILPTDILGFHIYRLDGGREFIRGPVFTNVLMFDELSRAPTRTQAALLEVMQEYRATVDGVTYPIPKPFMVVATQVTPRVAVGAYQIMETLADRFYARAPSYYNPPEDEVEIIRRASAIYDPPVDSVTKPAEVLELTTSLDRLVYLSDAVAQYIVNIVTYLRNHEAVLYGPSHRASIHLAALSRAYALMDGRDYVVPDDVKAVAVPVVAHKLRVREEYEAEGTTAESLVEEALKKVPVPK